MKRKLKIKFIMESPKQVKEAARRAAAVSRMILDQIVKEISSGEHDLNLVKETVRISLVQKKK
jgi:N-acetylglucosamine kinase-like BadF-type ATPase